MYGMRFFSGVFLALLLTGLLAGVLSTQQLGTGEKIHGKAESSVGSPVTRAQGSSNVVPQSTVDWHASELSWSQGEPFPVNNGCIVFPPLPPQEPTQYYYTHWYAGSITPSSLPPQNASSISMSITIPSSEPRPEEFYYVILSAFDSNGSYDQIGFSACFGTWGLSYSWTSGSPYPGNAVYNYDPIAMILSPGATYTFNITTQAGLTHFIALQGRSPVWSLDAPTGGDYLILSNYYSGGIRGRAPYDYTNYEEVYYTSTPEGTPNFDFTFSNNSWTSTKGSSNAAMWTPWYSPDKPFQIPTNVQVIISDSSVLVKNPGTWWPMFRHDPTHSAYSASTAPTTNQTLEWSYKTGASIYSSPAVTDDMVYIGSDDDNVYALNASTGTLGWRYHTGGWVESSPAVANGVVYVGSDDGNIYALNASTGALVWNYQTGGGVDSSPAVSGAVVYVGSYDNVYALNASTGALVWNYTTSWVESSPAVVDGVVYVGSDKGNVYALNAFTGTLLWSYRDPFLVRSSPAVADGVVYFGSYDKDFYALNASTGALIWWAGNPMIYFSAAVANGLVFLGSIPYPPGSGSTVRAFNASTHTIAWSYTDGNYGFSSPSVAGGVVFVGCGDNKTYALNATDGAFLWSYKTGWIAGSPAIVDGVVFVGSEDGNIYALGPRPFAHDVAVTNVTPLKTVVDQGFNNSIKVTVANLGSYTETFKVTTYATVFSLVLLNITIASQNITLASGNSATLTFPWSMAGYAYGNYNVSAYAWPVQNETNVANNNYTYNTVKVTVPGDLNGDGVVGTADLHILGVNWGLTVPPGDPNADINGDGMINTKDLHILGVNWGIRIVLPK